MKAEMLSSKSIVAAFKLEIQEKNQLSSQKGYVPTLTAIIVGEDGPSMAYALSKEKSCKNLGINFSLKAFDANISQEMLIGEIQKLNRDQNVHGIMLELPLPKGIDGYKVTSAIDPQKDVDGVTPVNRGLLLMGKLNEALLPVTPLSCITLIESANADISGKSIAVVGRGETVGLPLAVLLIKRSATVTVCHSKTKDLREILKSSDIVVAATGHAGLIKPDMLTHGQIVIDAGITVLPGGSIVGDVDPLAAEIVSYLTPVPGGVGALTVMLIIKNLFKAMSIQGK
ncbi:MAG: bifunctional 5,10-methylenetetrahydrofolate dehydrogenase/5,10-methenyltetrahydrofolate cyclohydrolase [Deltaproteobacteria bacterium]|nr:bifunctional 5,10-methylenetetrahydrofolate dehydrogenase/5,10-methenyltetrahydrofolate cyclohydrolase [Deltaproteobacteria bacterium]